REGTATRPGGHHDGHDAIPDCNARYALPKRVDHPGGLHPRDVGWVAVDQRDSPATIDGWFGLEGVEADWTDESATGFEPHVAAAWAVLTEDAEPLGRVPPDLAAVLAEVAVAGPAVCSLRAISAVTGLAPTDPTTLAAAAQAAWGFR